MEDWKYRQILSSPLAIAPERLDEIVGAFALAPDANVIDIGCGEGQMILALAVRYGARCTGTDDRPAAISDAQRSAELAGVSHIVNTTHADGFAYSAEENSFDATICCGGSWILGGFRRTLARLATWTKPGGLVAVGETFAFSPPEAAYFRGRSLAPSAFRSHEGNIAIGLEENLHVVNTWQASPEEWNEFHDSQFAAARRWIDANPSDVDRPEVESRLTAARRRFDDYDREEQRWAVYLFRKPKVPV